MTGSTPLIRVSKLTKAYHGNTVLNGIDFEVQPGQVKAVIGPSGSGKSTLLRMLALLETSDGGAIEFEGEAIGSFDQGGRRRHPSEWTLVKQRREIGMVFQRFNLFPHLTAVQNVMAGPTAVKRKSRAEAEERARALLAEVGLANRADAYPPELSGGQQQRVAIARALIMNPKVLLFDEPTSALDPELVGEVLEVMEGLAREGMTMVVVTHELGFARRFADEVAMFDEGIIVESAPPSELFDSPTHERTQRFLRAVA